jgi:hypothetical protein
MEILKPIFITGVPRSGTTVLYNLLTEHKDTAYFENYSSRYFEKPYMFRFIPLLIKYQKFRYGVSRPKRSEGWVWDRFHKPLDYLDENDFSEGEKKYYYNAIKIQLKAFNAKRFVSKNPRNCLRIRWINAIFPDAYHIVIMRDPKPVINSMYQAFLKQKKKWGNTLFQKPTKITHNYYRGYGYIKEMLGVDTSEFNTCINYYNYMNNTLKKDLSIIRNKTIEIYYNDFIKEPRKTLKKLFNFTELDWYTELEKKIPEKLDLQNNEKWKLLPDEEREILLKEFPNE